MSPPPSSRSTRRAALSPPSIPFMALRRAGVSTGHLFQSASASPRFSRDGQAGSEGSGAPSAPRKHSEAPSRRESFSQTSFAPSPSAAGTFSSAGTLPPNMPAGMAPDTRSQSSRSTHRDTALRMVCPAAYLRRRITGAEGVLPAATRAGERNMKGSLCPGRKTSCALRPKPGREAKRSRLSVSTPSAGSWIFARRAPSRSGTQAPQKRRKRWASNFFLRLVAFQKKNGTPVRKGGHAIEVHSSEMKIPGEVNRPADSLLLPAWPCS